MLVGLEPNHVGFAPKHVGVNPMCFDGLSDADDRGLREQPKATKITQIHKVKNSLDLRRILGGLMAVVQAHMISLLKPHEKV